MISFALAIHNHQPVGNFEHVLEQAYQQAYSPFINLLYQYPQIKLTLHYSGILWEWFEQRHPEFVERLQEMSARRQIELMSGAFYEPILPILPDADKRGQIEKMNRFLQQRFGITPQGFWLAERVWEPHLVKPLAECNLEYVIVDDSHFQEVGLENEQLYGYYVSEESGKTIKIFPGSKRLRYLIPFRPPQETIDYLHSLHLQGHSGIIQMGDDGEKFGVWPGTHQTVYNEGWLERFFNLLLENSSWLKVTTYAEYIKEHKPLGNVYLPTASYSEMMEWALPTPLRLSFEQAKSIAENNPVCRPCLRFLKGGFWRNFLIKYPEANQMHKKMLYVSQKLWQLDSCRDEQILEQAKNELWQAQCNCAYWHGVFGGLYLPHLRQAVYEHLIKAEQLLDRLRCSSYPWLGAKVQDLLLNGSRMVLISNPQLALYFNPDAGGSLLEWDYKPAALNLANTLSRRPETYHEKIRGLLQQPADSGEGPQSIHQLQHLKDKDLDKYLSYDSYQRSCLLDHFLAPGLSAEDFTQGSYTELGNFIQQPYVFNLDRQNQEVFLTMERQGELKIGGDSFPLKLKKDILIGADSSGMEIHYQISNLSDTELELRFGCEFNLAPAYPEGAYWQSTEARGSLLEATTLEELSRLQLVIDYIKLGINFEFDRACTLWSLPLQTVSQAEGGYERIYQGQTLLFSWRFKLAGKSDWAVNIKQEIENNAG